jgi:rhamnulokinase
LIFDEVKTGLKLAACRAKELDRKIQSIGVDSWAVDYGLLDADGMMIDDPVCYRDDRTAGALAEVFAQVPQHLIFERTGIQFQNFNTLYQLWSEEVDRERISKLLLLPDLLNYYLTGKVAAEFTNATTTQMVNTASGTWDGDLLDRLELPIRILPEIIPAGSDLGDLRAEIAEEVGLPEIHVVAPATHDTASAVAAAPISSDWAYISSGTWSLIGVENENALINEEVEHQNFTNEGGVYGTTRFLKNVMGLWILESCRKEWKDCGIELEYDVIINEVTNRVGFPALIFPDDGRFLNPTSMLDAIKRQLQETGQEFDEDPITVVKTIFDSLALRYASVLRTIETLTGRKLEGIQILGGGGRNLYLNQTTANAIGLNVRAGLYEATIIGNVLVQAISAGRFASLSEARKYITDNVEFVNFTPHSSQDLIDAAARYSEIENRFVNSH